MPRIPDTELERLRRDPERAVPSKAYEIERRIFEK